MLFPFPLFPAPLAPLGSLWGWVRLALDAVSQLLHFGALSSVHFSLANGMEVSQGSQLPPYSPWSSHRRLSAFEMSLSHQEEVLFTWARCQPGGCDARKMWATSVSFLLTSGSNSTIPGESREQLIGHSQIAQELWPNQISADAFCHIE